MKRELFITSDKFLDICEQADMYRFTKYIRIYIATITEKRYLGKIGGVKLYMI